MIEIAASIIWGGAWGTIAGKCRHRSVLAIGCLLGAFILSITPLGRELGIGLCLGYGVVAFAIGTLFYSTASRKLSVSEEEDPK